MNKKFNQQYRNEIATITDAMPHRQAIKVLEQKHRAGLIMPAALVGYRDAVGGTYDKYWRYSPIGEVDYQAGVQAAINNGASIERYIEVAECNQKSA